MSNDEDINEAERLLKEREIDPVTLQVIGGEFSTIAQEMGNKMVQSAYSSIIRESEDIGAGLFTRDCREIAESDFTPMHVGSLPAYLRGMYRAFEERGQTVEEAVNEGDVFLHNHPHYGASHAPDVAVALPIFHESEHIGWSANTAHLLDVGSATPGLAVDLYDVYGEGQLLKARKVYDRGERVDEIWNHLADNTRTARMNLGDLQVMIGAAEIGKRRYLGLIEEWGLETIQQAGEDLMAYAEALIRNEISKIPNGTYHEVGYRDDDGVNRGERLKIDVEVQIDDDEVTVDLSDSADQVPTGYNVPFGGSTEVAVYFTLRALLMDTHTHDEYIPQNSGTFEPINVVAREGSIFNPEMPASAFARINQVDLMGDLILKALSPVVPEKVMAGTASQFFVVSYSGLEEEEDEDEYWVYIEVDDASYGGRPEEDGLDCVDALITNTKKRSTEDVELSHPLRIDRYEMREDGHGAGENRGGHGVVQEMTFLTDTVITTEGDGKYHIPHGLFGGESGAGASTWSIETEGDSPNAKIYSLRDRDPDQVEYGPEVTDVSELYTKVSGYQFQGGDRYVLRSPMSGGYGHPYDRPVDKVYDDFRDGLIDRETARDSYGVVIEKGEVDREATEKRRGRRDQ